MNREANSFLLFLLKQNDFIQSIHFRHYDYWENGNRTPDQIDRVIHELERLKAIYISPDSKGKEHYLLTEPIRKKLENRPTKTLISPMNIY
jgi:hypothetical protein